MAKLFTIKNMQNFNRAYRKNWELKLNYCNTYDLNVSNDIINYTPCNLPEALFTFLFEDDAPICTPTNYDEAVSFNEELQDFFLTSIDNRRTPTFEPFSFNPSGSTDFCVFPVSGDNYDYYIGSGDAYVTLCGGFYQGFYKLEEYEYEVIPNQYKEGFTLEFWLNKDDICNVENTLPNKGIFFYWGVRSEDKFCNYFEGELGKQTSEGVQLSPELVRTTRNYFEEPLNSCNDESEYKYLNTCCNNLKNNAMAFQITEENEVKVMVLRDNEDCESQEQGEFVLEEYYTNPQVVKTGQWHQIVVKYKPYFEEECSSNKTKGQLSIFVDGFLQLLVEEFRVFIPYGLDTHRSKQIGVPYNMSFGGGTQGQLENITYGGFDAGTATDDTITYEYKITLINDKAITTKYGIIEDWQVEDVVDMVLLEEVNVANININSTDNYTSVLLYTDAEFTLDIKQEDCPVGYFFQSKKTILGDEGTCKVLEQHFAGSFIGKLGLVQMYQQPLCLQDIRCNYSQIIKIYES